MLCSYVNMNSSRNVENFVFQIAPVGLYILFMYINYIILCYFILHNICILLDVKIAEAY